jgi:hypothetical protein
MRIELTSATTFAMNFDFNSATQQEILRYLQTNNYQLLAYKGAIGPNQVAAGLPTWFAVPFGNIFGAVGIDYTPQYKVYIFNQATIAANTTIAMQSLSAEVGLGTALNFTQNGLFTSAGSSKPGTITLHNQRPAGTPNITVGLAGLVELPSGTQYLPFCAFTLTPMGSITMEPTENVAMMAAQVNLQSGNVQANASAPGCSFTFDSSRIAYELMITPSTYAITNQPQTTPVENISSGQALSFLNS